jgi:hypothetical protein
MKIYILNIFILIKKYILNIFILIKKNILNIFILIKNLLIFHSFIHTSIVSNISTAYPSMLYDSSVALPFSFYTVLLPNYKTWHSYVWSGHFLGIKTICLLFIVSESCLFHSAFNKYTVLSFKNPWKMWW